jgi:tetratricopeptide (TPR) repeat protein
LAAFYRWIIDLPSRFGRLAGRLMLAFALVGLIASSAAAQTLSAAERAELQARKEALFGQMLANPSNLDITFAYADVAARLGDNEAAVSALERMLLFNPNLPRVQLELGALYFRMGSYEISQSYFEKALAANPPPDVKSRIQTYLAEISSLSAPQRFSGYFMFGGQYQSDANLAPGSPLIASPIGPALLNSEFVKKNDVDVFATGAFLYSYDLGTQTRDTFEVGGTGFGNRYGNVNRLNLGLAELTAGPRVNFIKPLPGVENASLKPYAITNDVNLGGNQYFHTFGVGGEATLLTWHDIRLKSIFEFRDKNFNDAPDRPISRGLNGTDKLVSLFLTKPVTTAPFASELALEFDYLDQETRLNYYANRTYAVAAAYHLRYDDPTHLLRLPWDSTLFLSRSWAYYDGPDPCCSTSGNPFIFSPSDRFDRHWRFGVTQSFQVGSNISVVLQLQRDIVSSNLSLYGYNSDSVLIGPQIRF